MCKTLLSTPIRMTGTPNGERFMTIVKQVCGAKVGASMPTAYDDGVENVSDAGSPDHTDPSGAAVLDGTAIEAITPDGSDVSHTFGAVNVASGEWFENVHVR